MNIEANRMPIGRGGRQNPDVNDGLSDVVAPNGALKPGEARPGAAAGESLTIRRSEVQVDVREAELTDEIENDMVRDDDLGRSFRVAYGLPPPPWKPPAEG